MITSSGLHVRRSKGISKRVIDIQKSNGNTRDAAQTFGTIEGKMTAPSDEPVVLIIDSLPLRSLGLISILNRMADPRRYQLPLPTDEQEQWIETGANFEMLIYNASCPSIEISDNLQRIKEVRSLAPDLPLVILSNSANCEEIISALKVGVVGFLYKGASAKLTLQALSLILNGGEDFCSAMRQNGTYLAERQPPIDCNPNPTAIDGVDDDGFAKRLEDLVPKDLGLTARQKAVVELLTRGETNKVIARQLGMTEGTVKVHVRQIMRKLRVSNRTQVAIVCASGVGA